MKCFTLHVINLKYMKVSHFELSYKKKKTFSPYSYFSTCTQGWNGLQDHLQAAWWEGDNS